MAPVEHDPYRGYEPGEVAGKPYDATAHTVDDVLAYVGADGERAMAALAQEEASSRPRVTLVAGLREVIDTATAPKEEPVGDIDTTAHPVTGAAAEPATEPGAEHVESEPESLTGAVQPPEEPDPEAQE